MSFTAEIFARSTTGIELYTVTQQDKYEVTSKVVSSKKCFCMALSSDGKLLAYATSNEVIVIDCTTLKEICSVPKVRITQIAFSPQNNYLTFGHVAGSVDIDPNFFVLELSSKSTILELTHKDTSEPDFARRSFQWTSNEKHLIRIIHGKLIDYSIEISHINEWPVNVPHITSFSLSPFANDILIAGHFAGQQNAASSVKMLSLKTSPETRQITSKSFFQGDSMDYSWNKNGDMLLVVNNSETDKTRESYYGRKLLYFFNRKGDACQITVTKEGPIYYADWLPHSNKFIVICGKMPSEVHLFNHKAEFVKVISTGVFNRAHFNCFENLVLFCGFGNLPGNVRALDMETEKQLFDYKASFTTFLQIFFDGVHVLTATTYPHFKIDNGFKIWHYSGHLCYESPAKDKDYFLHQIMFRPRNGFTKPKLSTKVEVVGSITPTRPEPSQKAYVPPHLRSTSDGTSAPLPAKPPGRNKQPKKKKKDASTPDKTDESTKSDTVTTATSPTNPKSSSFFSSNKDNNKNQKQKQKNNAKKTANESKNE